MLTAMIGSDVETLVKLLAKLPGLGPRSARRAALALLKQREALMLPLTSAMAAAAKNIVTCHTCGNLDTSDPCRICASSVRDAKTICVVEDIADLWALERTGAYRGVYHVLGGVLSALDGIGPDDLAIPQLVTRIKTLGVSEIILALPATIAGQTTAHYLSDKIDPLNVKMSRLAHGVPMGGELDYLDDSTLTTALKLRTAV